ncbi:MAG TPA: nuclear transport factor 2 family protein [Candidatus Acidoferrales bacterium]|nr:nuclear transport factor 2 family protein [Candidatus Acidoferrales bacterium]
MEAKDLIQQYYESLDQKDNRWQDLYAEDALFTDASQVISAKGKEAVIQSFSNFLKGVEKVMVKEIIGEGENLCAIISYDYVNPKGVKWNQDVAEIWKVTDGKLAQLTIYFDLIAYRNFMRS